MSSGAEELDNLLKLIPREAPTSFPYTKKESKLNDTFLPPVHSETIVPTSSTNFFWTTDPTQQQFRNFVTSTYSVPDLRFPSIRRQVGNTNQSVLTPVDVRLLGNNRRFCVGPSGKKVKLSKNKKR